MRFGRYHPDYQNVMLDTRRRKRAYEMLPNVMDYKSKEVQLQNLIDEVLTKIALENVKIEVGNPFLKQILKVAPQEAHVIVVYN